MSLTLPRDNIDPATEPTLDSARQAHSPIPLRAQLSLLHQRVILTLRFLLRPIFRLPIDDVKEQQLEARLQSLLRLAVKNAEALNTLIGVSNQMQQRLLFYEAHHPRIHALRIAFDQEQARQQEVREAPAREAAERAAHGLTPVPPTNGHRPMIEVVR